MSRNENGMDNTYVHFGGFTLSQVMSIQDMGYLQSLFHYGDTLFAVTQFVALIVNW